MAIPRYSDVLVVFGLSLVLLLIVFGIYLLSKSWNNFLKLRLQKALGMRRNHKDKFREENGYSWDYVVVFKVFGDNETTSAEQQKYSMKAVLNQLAAGGLEVRLFYSVLRKSVFCKIRAPLERLLKEADLSNYPFATDPVQLENLCSKGRPGVWNGLQIPNESVETLLNPYSSIYLEYNFESSNDIEEDPELAEWNKELHNVYKKWPQYNHSDNFADDGTQKISKEEGILRGVDRLKLIKNIIASKSNSGCHLDIDRLVKDKCILGFFPLHDMVELKILEQNWFKILDWPWNLQTNDIKDYFGEKIGLFFVWQSFYTTWLIAASIVGFGIWIFVAVRDDPNAPDIPYFAGFMAAWSTLFLEFWKRKEKYTALEWGMVGFEEEEVQRPSFFGETIRSPVNGKPVLSFSVWERTVRSFRSFGILFGSSIAVILSMAFIFFLRTRASKVNLLTGTITTSILFAIEIQVLNKFYSTFALVLTEYENHRTETEFEDALIAKTFSFQFINGYSPLFYIAFFKPFFVTVDPCLESCMLELQTTLATIFLARIMTCNFIDVLVPLVQSWLVAGRVSRAYNKSTASSSFSSEQGGVTEVEAAFLLPEYDSLVADFAELVVQFGYSTMFITAFPLATIMCLVSNYISVRISAWKLSHVYRRPLPHSCEDIGTWFGALSLLSHCAVVVNSAIVAYTGTYTNQYTWSERAWIFILMASGLFSIKLFIAYIIPDVPVEVSIQLERQEFIKSKIHDSLSDANHLDKVHRVVPKYTVQCGDDDPL